MTTFDNDTLIERVCNPEPQFPLLSRMFVEKGSNEDWKLLHDLHYKSGTLRVGADYWRCTLDGETIGVMVTGSPSLLLKERHLAFPKLGPGAGDTPITNQYRAKWINANLLVIQRFVVDTMFRGVGVGYRFQNIATRMTGKPFMEIQSSMSKYNLFAQKAGFKFIPPLNATKYDVGLRFFRAHFASNPADHEGILAEINAMPESLRERMIAEMRDFYYKHSALEKTGNHRFVGKERSENMPVSFLLKQMQQMILASPLYGIYKNPDAGRKLPARIPLTAFDNQLPHEPLKLS